MKSQAKMFCVWVVAVFGAGALVVCVINGLALDVRKQVQSDLVQAYAIEHLPIETIVVGTSRSRVFKEPFVQWPASWGRVLVMDESNAPIRHMYARVRHAWAHAPVKQVVLLADFLSFNDYNKGGSEYKAYLYFDPLHAQNHHPLWIKVQYAFFDAYRTMRLLLSLQQVPTSYAYWIQSPKDQAPKPWEPEGAYGVLSTSLRFEATERHTLQETFFPSPAKAYEFAVPGTVHSTLDCFEDLVAFAYAKGLSLVVVIPPTHARLEEVIDYAGLWRHYEHWKRSLVSVLAKVAAQYGQEPFSCWDFGAYSHYTTLPVPDEGCHPWFFESSHMRPILAQKIIDRISDKPQDAQDWGVRLDLCNIEAHLKQTRLRQQQYRADHPQEQAVLQRLEAGWQLVNQVLGLQKP